MPIAEPARMPARLLPFLVTVTGPLSVAVMRLLVMGVPFGVPDGADTTQHPTGRLQDSWGILGELNLGPESIGTPEVTDASGPPQAPTTTMSFRLPRKFGDHGRRDRV